MTLPAYKKSTLWQTAFQRHPDGLDSQREKLEQAYDEFRGRVGLLLAQIQRELPALTLHDITHVDALWRVASEIAGPDFSINPAEALVLGGAFLLHDAAHCRAAFPGGINQLRATTEWRDSAAQRKLSVDNLEEGSEEFQTVLFDTLRVLHPKQARKLPFVRWDDGTDNLLFLFPHDELREAYGSIIGEIAESHWFHPHELEPFGARTLAAPVCLAPAAWTVNPLKVAVLLRVADAAHIDAMRAPRLLQAMNHPSGISADHWRFQARLHQPSSDKARGELVFSGGPFPPTEQAAWWLAYDAACLADKELAAAEHLLRDHGISRLAVREVAGVRSPESFSRNVPAEGWHPMDASLRISDIQSVVERFGGVKLYGDEPQLALRELLQNARDAVLASRALGALEEHEGSITVQLEENAGDFWLHIVDTGIGMGRYVLTNVLLDFGRSLWKDPALRGEWPGLAGTGFEAVGRFGIGFFSVFMLGKRVKVTTYRQTPSKENSESQWVLECAEGTHIRPLLRAPLANEILKRHGTRISVLLTNKTKLFQSRRSRLDIFSGKSNFEQTPLTLSQLIAALVPALEIDVFTEDAENGRVKVIGAGDWREIAPLDLINRIAPGRIGLRPRWSTSDLTVVTDNLTQLIGADGKILGRCAVVESSDDYFGINAGIVTVGGLYGGSINGLAGILEGEQSEMLNRSFATPKIDRHGLQRWSNGQAELLRAAHQLTWRRSSKLLALGADPGELFVISHGKEAWTANRLTAELKKIDVIWLLEPLEMQYQSEVDEVMKVDFDQNLELDHRIFVIESGVAINEFLHSTQWPSTLLQGSARFPRAIVQMLLNEGWPDAVLIEAEEVSIGNVGGQPIVRQVDMIFRTASSAKHPDGHTLSNSAKDGLLNPRRA